MPILSRGMSANCEAAAECAVSGGVQFDYDNAYLNRSLVERPNIFRPRLAVQTPDTRKARLARTIETEIIPRLMMAHQTGVSLGQSAASGETATKPNIAEFAELVVTQDSAIATSYVAALLDQGVTVETVYLNLLAPTARWLGDLWNRDLCNFTDVAIGLTRLHQVMTSVGQFARSKAISRKGRRRVLLISSREEMHNFGLFMVASFFRRADWDVFGRPLMTDDQLAALVRTESFHVVGISVSCSDHVNRARSAVSLIRRTSCNKGVKIIVGGLHFSEHPETAAEIGADATSVDGFRAVEVASQLVEGATSSH
jgi:methanogenic corrinoid protein MtbC1